MEIGDKAKRLMLFFEGMDEPWEWPGGASGITIGHGYDLGYESFQDDWNGKIDDETFNRLLPSVGIRGERAAAYAPKLRGVRAPESVADDIFTSITIPKYAAQTDDVFPGSSALPPDAFGALVSLVYNRGILIDKSDRRKEMLSLHKIFMAGQVNLNDVADLVESQKRLWPNKGPNSLYARRVAEAGLIRQSAG
jgi:GH24 family phage-related lysozyme (muramidase)